MVSWTGARQTPTVEIVEEQLDVQHISTSRRHVDKERFCNTLPFVAINELNETVTSLSSFHNSFLTTCNKTYKVVQRTDFNTKDVPRSRITLSSVTKDKKT